MGLKGLELSLIIIITILFFWGRKQEIKEKEKKRKKKWESLILGVDSVRENLWNESAVLDWVSKMG